MAKRHVVKVARHGGAMMVTIPRPLLFSCGLERGDHVALQQVGRSILVTPIEESIRERLAAGSALLTTEGRVLA